MATNPYAEIEDFSEITKLTGQSFKYPNYMPDGFIRNNISLIFGSLVQIIYSNGEENKITYRTEQTADDISGDYNEYETEETEEINGLSITLKGDGGKYYTAIWNDGIFSYALSADNELEKKIFIKIILEIR